jgi:hypothetical protein
MDKTISPSESKPVRRIETYFSLTMVATCSLKFDLAYGNILHFVDGHNL